MAVFRNVMAFLGLDDDDQIYDDEAYYEEEEHEERPRRGRQKTIAIDDRLPGDSPSFGFSADSEMNELGGVGAVRPLRPIETEADVPVPDALAGLAGAATPAVADRRMAQRSPDGAFEPAAAKGPDGGYLGGPAAEDSPVPSDSIPSDAPPVHQTPESPRPRPGPATEEGQSHVVTHAKPRLHIPSSFEDASRIADDFGAGSPVVMNLTAVDKPVARRLVDFASGVCYVLAGGMERVAANVYLLTPSGVDVSADDRRRMQERGFER
ncbi:MAG: cell division protein SepF [Acidimicrobiia bacterium]|nr:cell division protein SepF [Acidimicrobiia bacterium]